MNKIYLASRYSRKQELLIYKKELEKCGYEVTARWLTAPGPRSDEKADFDFQQMVADNDVEDILAADTLIAFTEVPRAVKTRGGRHVEFGVALGAGKEVIIIGPVENDFCAKTGITQFESWKDFMESMCGVQEEYDKDEVLDLKVTIEQQKEYIKALVAALHDATHDNIDLYDDKGNMQMILVPKEIDRFLNEYKFTFDYTANDDILLTYSPSKKKGNSRKPSQRIY